METELKEIHSRLDALSALVKAAGHSGHQDDYRGQIEALAEQLDDLKAVQAKMVNGVTERQMNDAIRKAVRETPAMFVPPIAERINAVDAKADKSVAAAELAAKSAMTRMQVSVDKALNSASARGTIGAQIIRSIIQEEFTV